VELEAAAVEPAAGKPRQRHVGGAFHIAERAAARGDGDEAVEAFAEAERVANADAGGQAEVAIEPRAAIVGRGEAGETLRARQDRHVRCAEGGGGRGDDGLDAHAVGVAGEEHAPLQRREAERAVGRDGREETPERRLLRRAAAVDRDVIDEALDDRDAERPVGEALLGEDRLREHEAADAVGGGQARDEIGDGRRRDRLPEKRRPDRREVRLGDRGCAVEDDAPEQDATGRWGERRHGCRRGRGHGSGAGVEAGPGNVVGGRLGGGGQCGAEGGKKREPVSHSEVLVIQ
jgi:hypothetical protein